MDFFKFPHTPHLAWLGPGQPRNDKVLSAHEREAFLDGEILIEEKVDGANLGLSVAPDGRVRAQNRGAYLSRGCHPQFERIWAWLAPREAELARTLGEELVIFGEWCFAVHSVRYDRLPDWFLGFDVYDRGECRFWSSARRDGLLASLGFVPVPVIARTRFDLHGLCDLLERTGSRVGCGPAEGFYLRLEDEDWLLDCAKLVRVEFVQAIGEHWSRRSIEKNCLAAGAGMIGRKKARPR